MRADLFLFQHGIAKSRSHAVQLIHDGAFFGAQKIIKPSQEIPDQTDPLRIRILNPSKYVSRGGLKLEAALHRFAISPSGKTVLDLGASTGGFTDCLLQHGAKKIFAVDVGHGQLDPRLAKDPRVVCMEGVNARILTEKTLGERCELTVSDLSFISQSLVYPAVAATLKEGGVFISLVKPQFEAGRAHIGKGGIVRDRTVHEEVIARLISEGEKNSLYGEALTASPIEGGDGNREYLLLFRFGIRPVQTNIHIKHTVWE